MKLPEVILKSGRDIPVRAGHPWIFSNALSNHENLEAGALVNVYASDGEGLGIGIFNPNTSIRVRMITKNLKSKIDADFFAKRFLNLDLMKRKYLPAETTGYRVAHGDADYLPGLIVDKYEDHFVFQIHTAGMDRLRPYIIDGLKSAFKPHAVVERSDIDAREIEGLDTYPVQIHFGSIREELKFKECGLEFFVDPLNGHKTGFYLDQRDARVLVRDLAKGKSVLNLFGYTGAFGIYASKGGANRINTVEISSPSLALAKKNFQLNGLSLDDATKLTKEDVFKFLESPTEENYDLIICDPPAFTKSQRNIEHALKSYTFLNRRCIELLKRGGILVTSSCSGVVTMNDFLNMIKLSAGRAQKDVRVLQLIGQSFDHTQRISFPEGRYLKTAVLETVEFLP